MSPMTFRYSAPAILLAAAAVACASTQAGDAQDVAGCYYFEQDATARQLNLPWGVRLTTEPLTGWPALEGSAYVAVTLWDVDRTTDFPFGYWQTTAVDSIRIGYPGMGGFSLELTPENGVLEGVAVPMGDAGLGPRTPHPIRLQHARCPGE